MQTVLQHQEVAGLAHKKVKEILKQANILISKVYLELIHPVFRNLFCESNQCQKVVNYFCKKAPSRMFGWILNMPLCLMSLTSQKLASTPRRSSLDQHIKNILKKQQIKKMYIQDTTNKHTYLIRLTYQIRCDKQWQAMPLK